MVFVCPKCASPFVKFENNSAACENGHSYDRAREGYYNFLPPKAPHTHGDNREMLLARRAFLDTGMYLPLLEGISTLAKQYAPKARVALDIGCGEGYYTNYLAKNLKGENAALSFAAFDISKDAVKLSAKRGADCDFAVASAYRMPIADASVDLAFNVFSPLALSETVRVLSPGGVFIMAIPNAEHLFELKAQIYEHPYKNAPADFLLSGLEFVTSREISYKMELDTQKKLLSLFAMTPYAYRTKQSDADRLLQLNRLDVTASFIVIVYKKPC